MAHCQSNFDRYGHIYRPVAVVGYNLMLPNNITICNHWCKLENHSRPVRCGVVVFIKRQLYFTKYSFSPPVQIHRAQLQRAWSFVTAKYTANYAYKLCNVFQTGINMYKIVERKIRDTRYTVPLMNMYIHNLFR